MSLIDTTLTNTILVPTDSLPESNPLSETTVAAELEKFNNKSSKTNAILGNEFKVYIRSGDKSVQAAYCESIDRLEVRRAYESIRSGGNAGYTVNLPGAMSNGYIRMTHLVTDNEAFLNWIINGASFGGVQTADIELRVGEENDYMLYIFRDAFPIKWNFGTLRINMNGMAVNEEILTYTMQNGDILVEHMDIVYGKLEYKVVSG